MGSVHVMIGGTLTQTILLHVHRKMIPYTFVLLAIVVGMVAGGIVGNSLEAEIKDELQVTMANYFSANHVERLPPTFEYVIQEALMKDVLQTVLVVFLLGLTVIGSPFILIILFMRGFSLAFTFIFLIQDNVWRGSVLALTGLVPHNAFSLISLCIIAAAAFTFAGAAARILLGRKPVHYNVWRHLSSFTRLAVVASLFVVIGMFIEAYITPFLIQFALEHIV